VGPVAAGADDVDDRPGDVEGHALGRAQHGIDHAPQLVDGLALHAQGDDEPGDLHVGGGPGQDLGHRRPSLGGGEVVTPTQRPEHGGPAAHLVKAHRPSSRARRGTVRRRRAAIV
jgi:hypothetical protein